LFSLLLDYESELDVVSVWYLYSSFSVSS